MGFFRFLRGLIFSVIFLIVFYLFFSCVVNTYWYSYKVNTLRDKIESIGCYNKSSLPDHTECYMLVSEHNEIIRNWNELSCIGYQAHPPPPEVPLDMSNREIEIVIEN